MVTRNISLCLTSKITNVHQVPVSVTRPRVLNTEHFLAKCDGFACIRLKFFEHSYCDLEYILENYTIDKILKFIKATKRLE